MGYSPEPFYGSVAVVRFRRGDPEVLFVDARPKKSPQLVLRKCPGGTGSESSREAAVRETEEETGILVKSESDLIPVHRLVVPGYRDHVKVGYMLHWEQCGGKLKKEGREEEYAFLSPPYWIALEEAIKVVIRPSIGGLQIHKSDKFFHQDFLINVWTRVDELRVYEQKQKKHVRVA